MKRQIQKSNHGLTLGIPSLIESKTTFAMQFLFYFLFLLLGVYGTYGCFYTAFSIPLSLQVVVPYTIVFCAVFTIAFLTKNKRILLLILCLVAIVFIILIRRNILDNLINQLTQGFFHTYNSVISVYAPKLHYDLFIFQTTPAGISQISAYITIFILFTMFFFTLLIAWMLIRRKPTILCFVLTVPFLGASVVFSIIPNYATVAALYTFWALLILNSSFTLKKSKFNKKRSLFYSGEKSASNPQSIIFLPILLACLVLVSILFPIQSFQRSDLVNNMRISLLSLPEIPSPLQIPIQSIIGYNNRVNLQQVGNITFTGNAVLRVQSSNLEPDYLKGFVGSIYTGQSWDPLPETEYEKLDSTLNKWKVQNFSSLFNNLLGRPANTYDITIQHVKRNSLRVYAPYGLISKPEELPGIDFINDGFLRSKNTLSGASEYSMKATNLQIDAWKISESLMGAFISEQSSFINAAKKYKDFVYSHYTQLPEMLNEKLDKYRLENNLYAENFLTPNAFANAVINKIHSENTYSLSPGMTPAEHDFVEYFLFENHKGYCVHFASATVALLRSAGIPARYVEGYAVSPSDFQDNNDWANIPDSRSHAWVEIYLSAVGWVPVEATPGAQRGIIDHEAAEAETNSSNPLDDEFIDELGNIQEPSPAEDPFEENSEYESTEEQSSNNSPEMNTTVWLLSILAILGLLTAALIYNRRLQASLRHKHFTQQDSKKAAIAVYEYIMKLYEFTKPNGTADCSIPKDLYNLVLKARFSQHMLTEQELERLLIYAENQALEILPTISFLKRFIGRYVYALF